MFVLTEYFYIKKTFEILILSSIDFDNTYKMIHIKIFLFNDI